MQRIRLIYSKGEELRYTGLLDMQKVWERIFRRADLQLSYSQGFHPQPKIHQACPLPLGFTSSNDLLDFWLDSDESLAEIRQKMEPALQPGILIQEYQNIPLNEKPLQTLVTAAMYTVLIENDKSLFNLQEKIDTLMHAEHCTRERRGKAYDLLPLILSLEYSPFDPLSLRMTLFARPAATGRPEEVLDALGIPLSNTSITRTGLLLSTQEPA